MVAGHENHLPPQLLFLSTILGVGRPNLSEHPAALLTLMLAQLVRFSSSSYAGGGTADEEQVDRVVLDVECTAFR
uniref:Uncharacterized protein n=1 Tax=Ditylenchus dipsaci TaxID=166011 RepID=A0A915CQD0_9BILA